MKVCQYLCLYIKDDVPKGSHYNTFCFLWYAHRDMWNVCLQTYTNSGVS